MTFSALPLRSTAFVLVLVSVAAEATHGVNVSNTLGDGMVLQHASIAPGYGGIGRGRAGPAVAATADCETTPSTGFATALAVVRARPAGTPATISVRGVCRVAKPIKLGRADSGLKIAGVSTPETPEPGISGGVSVTGWTVSAPAACKGCGSIYVSDLPPHATHARQFYVGKLP